MISNLPFTESTKSYESSCTKLFQRLILGRLTTGGLFNEYTNLRSYVTKAMAGFMSGTFNLLMKAAALEMTYVEINNNPNYSIKKQDWIKVKRKAMIRNRQFHVLMCVTLCPF